MALTIDEKNVLFDMIRENYITKEENDELRIDDNAAREAILEYATSRVVLWEREKIPAQERIDKINSKLEILRKVLPQQ